MTICVVGAMELSKERPKGVDGFLSPTGRARVAAAIQPLRLTATEGPGQLTTADGSFQALGAGAELAGGAQVRSGSRSVRLVVADNFEVNLAPNSLLTLEASNGREVFLRLRRGSVSCQVAKRRPGQRFGVLAGSYRVSVVGTEFTVSYPRVGDVSVEVSEGAVRVDEAATLAPTRRHHHGRPRGPPLARSRGQARWGRLHRAAGG